MSLEAKARHVKVGITSLGLLMLLVAVLTFAWQRRATNNVSIAGGPVVAKKQRTKGAKPKRLRSVDDDDIIGDEAMDLRPV